MKDLEARLRAAQAAREKPASRGLFGVGAPASGFGMAFRIGVELVSALAVGVGIGVLLDRWLGTAPWLLVVFFFLGAAAGIVSVYRTASGIGLAVGYRRPEDQGRGGANGGNEERGGRKT